MNLIQIKICLIFAKNVSLIDDGDDILQYYLRYRCLHFIVYGPLNLENIHNFDKPIVL